MPQSGAQMCSQDVSERMLNARSNRPKTCFRSRSEATLGAADSSPFCMKLAGKPAGRGTNREETGWVCSHEKRRITRRKPSGAASYCGNHGRQRPLGQRNGLPRKAGHKVGAETFRTIATYCKDIGVQYFTVYAFSTENWKRPQDEVDALMNLFRSYLKEAAETMFERGVAVRVLGDLTVLPEDIRAQIAEVDEIADRLGPDAATASLCINYGGRDEIKNAVRAIAQQVKNGELAPGDIAGDTITANLYTAHMPDRDLIIRPSGEIRTSTSCCGSPPTSGALAPMCAGGLQNHRSGCGNRQF